MKKRNGYAFALGTADQGYRNQIAGAIGALYQSCGNIYPVENSFFPPSGLTGSADLKTLTYSQCRSYNEFRKRVFALLDFWLPQFPETPRIFVTAYNFTESSAPEKNVDMVCRVVKEYYRQRGLGNIFTTVLSSRLHNYKYVDLINVPKHLLTFYARVRLLQNRKLRKKTLITIGIIHKFTYDNVKKKKNDLESLLKKSFREQIIKRQSAKLKNFIQKAKKVVICLGGRVEGPEIIFDVNYAKSILEKCVTLIHHGYGVVIVNGPRTPNDVTDYFYEKTSFYPDIVFHNCKKIAASDEERNMWRIYSGKYEEEFTKLKEIGNIYPAVLGYENTLAVHTADTFACFETIGAGIPTAISSEGIYIDRSVRGDCLNMLRLLTPKYAVAFEMFVDLACYMGIEPKNLHPAGLSDLSKVFVEAVWHRIE